MKHVLVVDDEARIREVVEYTLAREGFRVSLAVDGQSALACAERELPDLVVLDVMLPDIDGLEVCRDLRRRCRVPILFLSARGEEVDRVVGLELGGDDYLTKPFSPRELVARVRAVLRRFEDALRLAREQGAKAAAAGERKRKQLVHQGIELDFERHEVRYAGQLVDLTRSELAVLAALLEQPGVVRSRAELVEHGRDDGSVITERTIDTHVRRIRRKFSCLGIDPITTVHGVGYKASRA
jgi:two-component system OmpR family response regulator